MNEYTPTTELAKRAYVTGMRQAFIASAGEHAEEFDRWLKNIIIDARHEAFGEGLEEGYKKGYKKGYIDGQKGQVVR